jgi:NAD(P)H-hydrate epimerase
MLGAAALCGLSAMRAGAGLVTVATPQKCELPLQKKLNPGIMTMPLPEKSAAATIAKKISRYHAIGIGPGLGRHPQTQKNIRQIITQLNLPMVIDADALNALAGDPKILLKTPQIRILTPHPGEMARLTGKGKSFIENNRTAAAKNFARKYRCILVLKGHRTIVAQPNGKIYINRTGNAGMAKAGSGDVLTGIITALLAQGIEPFTAARWSVFLHGRAGDLAAKDKGKVSLIATDLIDYLPKAIRLIR